MPQHPLRMTTARAEKLFAIDIVDAPPPLQVEAVDRPPLAAIAPDPPIEPMPPTPPQEEPPVPPPAPPAPPPLTAAEAHAASVREGRHLPAQEGPREAARCSRQRFDKGSAAASAGSASRRDSATGYPSLRPGGL